MQTTVLHEPLFATSHQRQALPYRFLWVAIVAAFLILHAPPKRLSVLVLPLIQATPQGWFHAGSTNDARILAQRIVWEVLVPLKAPAFLLAVVVIGYPMVRALLDSGPFWRRLDAKRLAWRALLLAGLLSILVIPYGNPNGPFVHRSGLAGLGVLFGEMSVAPFANDNDMVYGRLLKPALAHFVHLDGYARYYLLSLVCGFLLVFLTVVFFESKLGAEETYERHSVMNHPLRRWPIYLSVMTSSFIMTSFQSPGKVDHLVFIFLLLMVCLPMTPQARLGIVALCLLTHEAITLALVPAIIFFLPERERSGAVLVVVLFFAVMAGSYGLSPSEALKGHGSTVKETSVWQIVYHYPGYALAGLVFSYKLLWGVLLYALRRVWNTQTPRMALQLATITLFPLLFCLLAWDTTRIGGVGFIGLLIAMLMLMKDFRQLPNLQAQAWLLVIYANILIPSYNVILYPPVGDGPPVFMNTLGDYPYLGLYRLIHSMIRLAWP